MAARPSAKYLAPGVVAAFLREYPALDVQITVGNRDTVLAMLEQLDLAIMGNPPPALDLERSVIGRHPHVIVAPAGHRLAQRRSIAASELSREVMLQREVGSGTRALMERTFTQLGIEPAAYREHGSNETIKHAVIAGLGLAFVSAHTAGIELQAGLLSVLPVEGLPIIREWHVVRLKGRQLSPASRAMWDFVTARGQDLVPDLSHLIRQPERKRKRKNSGKFDV